MKHKSPLVFLLIILYLELMVNCESTSPYSIITKLQLRVSVAHFEFQEFLLAIVIMKR